MRASRPSAFSSPCAASAAHLAPSSPASDAGAEEADVWETRAPPTDFTASSASSSAVVEGGWGLRFQEEEKGAGW